MSRWKMIEEFVVTTKRSRKMDDNVRSNICFLLENMRQADVQGKEEVFQHSLSELTDSINNIREEVSDPYHRKLRTFVGHMINTQPTKKKEKESMPKDKTTNNSQEKVEHPLLKALKHFGVTGSLKQDVFNNTKAYFSNNRRTFVFYYTKMEYDRELYTKVMYQLWKKINHAENFKATLSFKGNYITKLVVTHD